MAHTTYEVFGHKPDGHRLWLYTATDREQRQRAINAGLVVMTTRRAEASYGTFFRDKGEPGYIRHAA